MHLQLCAIYSQLHRHKNALEQAMSGIQVAHLVVRDTLAICQYFSKRLDFLTEENGESKQSAITSVHQPSQATDNTRSIKQNSRVKSTDGMESDGPSDFFDAASDHSDTSAEPEDGNYMSEQAFHNNLGSSLSLIERSAKLQKQVYSELLRLIKPLEAHESMNGFAPDSLEQELAEDANGQGKSKERKADMRHILGFLNQSEWIATLNIGNIMQISPVQLEDLLAIRRNE
jgi:hypothetical protein